MNIIKHILTFGILFISFCSFSQLNEISGIVKDSDSKINIEFAEVKLLNLVDSTIVTGDFSDSSGFFNLKSISNGSYLLVISFFDYDSKIISPIEFPIGNESKKIGDVFLTHVKSNQLGEIDIVVKKDAFQIGLDKKVYNVGEDISSRGGSANDVLIKVPSVDIDQDGNISLRGDGNVRILIDGRPSSMTGGNGKSLLDGIPASSIERIEIINNPSAKYDPDGTSGIINIVLKKNKIKGTNGMLTNTLGTSRFINSSASVSVRNSKINAYANYTYKNSVGYRNNWGTLNQLYNNEVVSSLKQNRTGMDSAMTQVLKIGTDFYLTSNQTLGFSVTGNYSKRARTGDLTNHMYIGSDSLTRLWERTSYDPTVNNMLDLNLYHQIDLKNNKGKIESFITQSIGKSDNYGYYQEKYFTLDSTSTYKSPKDQQLQDLEKNNVFTFQSDYSKTFDKKKSRIEAGVKAIVRNLGVNTASQTMDTVSNLFNTDTLSNFIYSYNEQVYGAYVNYGQEKGKFKYQGGLRIEQAFQLPYLISKNEKYTNNYFNVYPSGHLKYNPKENIEWSLSYSRRINRASSDDLNPFTSYADPFNLRKGNPALKPEYINSFDLGYSVNLKKLSIVSSVYYRHTNDVIQRVKVFNSNNASTITFANIDQSHSGGLEMVFSYKPYKWWKNTLSFNGSLIKFVDNTSNYNYNNSGFNFTAKYVSSVEHWNKTMVSQINIQYNAPQTTAQGIIQRRGAIELSTEKSFFHNKLSAGLRVSDLLNRQGFILKVRQPTIQQDSQFKWLTRRIYFTLTYKFGKMEMMNKSKNSNEAPSGGGMDF